MPSIQHAPLPTHALLTKYANAGAYTDCFVTEVAGTVSHAEFVEAFYTGGLFKVERFLLRVFVAAIERTWRANWLTAFLLKRPFIMGLKAFNALIDFLRISPLAQLLWSFQLKI